MHGSTHNFQPAQTYLVQMPHCGLCQLAIMFDFSSKEGTHMKFVMLSISLIFSASCVYENENLDTSEYEKDCTEDIECEQYTSQCPNADCKCPNFSALSSESDRIQSDRQNLTCTRPSRGITCECEPVVSVCQNNRCTLVMDGVFDAGPQ